MKAKWLLSLAPVGLGVVGLVAWAAYTPGISPKSTTDQSNSSEVQDSVQRVDELFEHRWKTAGMVVAEPAPDLQILRRLSLSLRGTVPSLDEIRQFEFDASPDRLSHWTDRILADERFFDYFAERLARCYVGTDQGQLIIFRRDRFVDWLREQLKQNRPYDEMVREMIAGQGLWTGQPQTNFITAAFANDEIDENKLAGRSVRAFLGQRMDCAQCHDHPFDKWKQHDFEGLAAYFGQATTSVAGVEDKIIRQGKPVEFFVEDRNTLAKREVRPCVPFDQEWMPATGTRREQLAAWITHPENRRFERAVANRIWGLLFGRPYHVPVDDLPDPPNPGDEGLLDILGADFRAHGCDLRHLIRAIASSSVFRLDSSSSSADEATMRRMDEEWALFPLTRLRPEQVIGSMLQAGSVKTIDQNSHLFVRFLRAVRESDFIQEYGDAGEDELNELTGTIPQALLRMNGKLPREIAEANLITASGRIAMMASTDEGCAELCFLVCLSRRPTHDELAHFLPQLRSASGKQRGQVVEDLYWALFNSPEFSWNH
jgi:hypothetical protein